MKKLNWLIILLGLTFVLASCSDDDDDDNPVNPTVENYFVVKSGDAYTYSYYPRDDDDKNLGNEKVSETYSYKGETDKYGMSGVMEVEIVRDNGDDETIYFAQENEEKFYAEIMYILPQVDFEGVELPFDEIANTMVVVASKNESQWDIRTEAIDPVSVPITDGINADISGTLTITGSRGNIEDIETEAGNMKAQKFTINYNFKGEGDLNIAKIPIEFDLQLHFYFAENIGLVKQIFPSKTITISVPGFGSESFPVTGFERVVASYDVK